MVVKKAAPDKFAILMGYNAKFHDYMAELSNSKKEEDVVYVQPQVIKALIADIKAAKKEIEATPQLKNAKTSLPICEGTSIYDCFINLAKISGNLEALKEYDGMYIFSAGAFHDLKDKFVDNMANLVHDGAAATVLADKELKSCKVGSFQHDDGFAINKYCSGAKPHDILVTIVPETKVKIGTGEQLIRTYPTHIKHTLGQHSVMPSFQASGEETAMAVEYHDSDKTWEPGSTYRLKGVKERLDLMGFKCGVVNPAGIQSGSDVLYCNIKDIKLDTIRELATYFSFLLNADTSHQGEFITPLVRDSAWEYAQAENQKYGDNTWQSGHMGQLDWEELKNKMEEEKKFTKNILYNQLRELTILRDIHHMIEEKYGLDHGNATIAGMKAIVENGKKILDIVNKNKEMHITTGLYAWNTIGSRVKYIEDAVKAGNAANISGPSDHIGHAAHEIIYVMLGKAGQYGNCHMGGGIANINTGNLAYCEGILEGEAGSAAPGSAGNDWTHKIIPLTINNIIDEDDFSDFEYTFKISPPPDAILKKDIVQYLKTQGFNCSGNLCKVATKDLDKIRQMALFLSNLKGVDIKVGEECAKKAIESAASMAAGQNKKGIFAFTQSPIHTSTKEWVDICFKQYGITPPGMTEEDKGVLELIGTGKTYGGCSFEQSDVLPNLGYVKYCEGVRKNPTAIINAYFTPEGVLDHYFHGSPGSLDKIATIDIATSGNGKHEISITGLNMRDKLPTKPLQHLVIKRLKSMGLTCPDITKCATSAEPLSEAAVRHLAAYLSSMHHAYNVSAECIPLAEEYAWQKAIALPNDVTAHDSMVHPFEKKGWEEEVCVKAPAPEAVPGEKTAADAVAAYVLKFLKENGPTGTAELYTAVVKKFPDASATLYNAGIHKIEGQIKLDPTSMKVTLIEGAGLGVPQKIGYGALTKLIADAKGKGKYFELAGCFSNTAKTPTKAITAFCAGLQTTFEIDGKPKKLEIAVLSPEGGTFLIAGTKVPVVFSSKGNTLYFTLPPEMMHPKIVEYLSIGLHLNTQDNATWSTPGSGSMFKAGRFLSYLQNFPNIPEDCKEKAIANAMKESQIPQFGEVVHPFDMKEWTAFCAPQVTPEPKYTLPPEPAPQKQKPFSAILFTELETLTSWVCAMKYGGKTLDEVYDAFGNNWPHVEFGAETKGSLNKMYKECPPAPAEKPDIGHLIAESAKELSAAQNAFGADVMNKAVEVTEYKKLPQVMKNWMHALFNWQLLKGYQAGIPYEKTIANVQQVLLKELGFKITPLMIKLQLDLEKKAKICKGELPAETGTSQPEACEATAQAKKEGIILEGFIADLLKEGHETKKQPYSYKDIHNALWTLEGVEVSEDEIKQVMDEMVKEGKLLWVIHNNTYMWNPIEAKQTKEAAPTSILGLSDEILAELHDIIKNNVEMSPPEGDALKQALVLEYLKNHNIDTTKLTDIDEFISQTIADIKQEAAEQGFPGIKEFIDSEPSVVSEIQDFVTEKCGGDTPEDCALAISKKFSVSNDAELIEWVKEQLASGLSTIEGIEKIMGENPDTWFYAQSLFDVWADNSIELGEPPAIVDIDNALVTLYKSHKISKNKDGYYGKLTIPEGNWYFEVSSEDYGVETYGPYDTQEEAEQGIVAVKAKVAELKDGIEREYTEPYQKMEEAEPEEKEPKGWEEMTDAEKLAFAIKVTAAHIAGWTELKNAAVEEGIIPDEAVLPSLMELHEMAKGKAEGVEEAMHNFDNLPVTLKKTIKKFVVDMASDGLTQPQITLLVKNKYGVFTDTPLMDYINETVTKFKKAKEEEKPNISWSNLSEEQQMAIAEYAHGLKAGGWQDEAIYDKLHEVFNKVEKPLPSVAILVKMVEDKTEKPPTPGEQIEQETMASFIKQGMSAQAVAQLFGSIVGEAKMKKTADKLYKLYHPDEEVMTKPLTVMPIWVQNKAKAVAESMLNSGKTQEDTAWYIAYNYHLTKESVKHMVNALAKIPISKTEELLKAFKILGIGKELGGCTVDNGGLSNIKGQTVSYCQGVVAPIGSKPVAKIFNEGERVDHTTDHQKIIINTKAEEKTWETSLDFTQNGAGENPVEHVSRVLRDWGFSCEKAELPSQLICQYRGSNGQTMSIEDQDSLRRTALFLSMIDNIPLLPGSCIPKAMEYAKNHAIAVGKTSKPWTVAVFPSSVEEWNSKVCEKVGG